MYSLLYAVSIHLSCLKCMKSWSVTICSVLLLLEKLHPSHYNYNYYCYTHALYHFVYYVALSSSLSATTTTGTTTTASENSREAPSSSHVSEARRTENKSYLAKLNVEEVHIIKIDSMCIIMCTYKSTWRHAWMISSEVYNAQALNYNYSKILPNLI